MKVLTTAANHSLLWFSVAAVLASRKGVTRRAALRGVAAIAGASASTNLVAKPVLPRRRPAAELMPARRRLTDPPTSSSFPSGHAASAVAFATAVAMESPRAALVVAPAAAAVAYSRVHTGVHWPSDVVGGAMIGASVALATRRWWPVRPEQPARARPSDQVSALAVGQGMIVLVNASSGDAGHDPSGEIAAVWPAAKLVHPSGGVDLGEHLATVVDAAGSEVRAIGVAGGDGTVAVAAAVAGERNLPLAVVPAGTLNHFARDVGVGHVRQVADAVASGSAVHVDLGAVRVDDRSPRYFVNTASLGGYPDMVLLREKWQPRWGKWPTAAAALIRVLCGSRPLDVRIDGKRRKIWLLFVGASGYQPKGFAPSWRPRLDDGLLDVRYVRADVRFSRFRFAFAAITGALFHSRTYVEQERSAIEVEVLGEPVALACDGEVCGDGNRFRFVAREAALKVYRPDAEHAPARPA